MTEKFDTRGMSLKDAMSQVSRFSNMTTAHGAALRGTMNYRIVKGDGGQYWVCSFRVAQYLTSHGYAYAY